MLTGSRFLLDTVFIQALLNRRDRHHEEATALLPQVRDAGRPDKEWGLTDCISFVVMRERDLMVAVTADEHFVQAGFQTFMTPARS